jgi:prolyl 4-hydroxylase
MATILSPLLQLEQRARAGDISAQIELGLLMEKGGGIEEGMNWLSLAARGGDPRALMLVGVRLVTGPYAPAIAVRGRELLCEALRGGSADAAAMLAVLHAAGAFARKDWTRAVDLLACAATLGRVESQVELAILADGPRPRRRRPAANEITLRERVDIQAWLGPREGRALSASPRIVTTNRFASARACAWIMDQARPRLSHAEVYDPATGRTRRTPERNNRFAGFGLAETNLVVLAVQEALAATAGAELAASEAASVLCYAPGEQAGEHFDFLDPAIPAYAHDIAAQGQRVATGLLYLNDDFSGGTTDFVALGLSHRPRAGSALVFSNVTPAGEPDRRSLHAGRPPRDGAKWVLSCFIRSRSRLPG